MMTRKVFIGRLMQCLCKTLEKPATNVRGFSRTAFDRNLQFQLQQIQFRQRSQKSASSIPLPPYRSRTPLFNSARRELLPETVTGGLRNISGISNDLLYYRYQGPLCIHQQSASYRTASGNRAPSKDKDTTKESARARLKEGTQNVNPGSELESKDDVQASGSIFQRFKQAYKEHGKILIGVHIVTSTVWFGSFFYAASVGIDVVPWLEHVGLNETIIKPFRSPNVGNIAMAYLMYKLATPARYTVTLGGTNLVIRYMRNTGRMEPVPEGDSFRELYKEGKSQMTHRRTEPLKHKKPNKRSK